MCTRHVLYIYIYWRIENRTGRDISFRPPPPRRPSLLVNTIRRTRRFSPVFVFFCFSKNVLFRSLFVNRTRNRSRISEKLSGVRVLRNNGVYGSGRSCPLVSADFSVFEINLFEKIITRANVNVRELLAFVARILERVNFHAYCRNKSLTDVYVRLIIFPFFRQNVPSRHTIRLYSASYIQM